MAMCLCQWHYSEVPTCSWTVQFQVLGYKSYFLPRSDRLCHSLCLNRFVPSHQGLYLPGLTDANCRAGELGHISCPSLLLVSMWVCAQVCLWACMHTLVEATGQPLICSPGANSFFSRYVVCMYICVHVCVLITAVCICMCGEIRLILRTVLS